MDRVNCTKEELVKTLTNSVTVKLFSTLGGPPRTIRVFKLSGEYVSVFERPPTEHALPPLECAAVFSAEPPPAPALAEPPTAPALAPRNPPTAPPAASPTGLWPLAQTTGAASLPSAPPVHPTNRAATQLAAPTQPLAVAFAAQEERDDEADGGSPNQELHAPP